MGVGPTTFALATRRSTTELHPHTFTYCWTPIEGEGRTRSVHRNTVIAALAAVHCGYLLIVPIP